MALSNGKICDFQKNGKDIFKSLEKVYDTCAWTPNNDIRLQRPFKHFFIILSLKNKLKSQMSRLIDNEDLGACQAVPYDVEELVG